MDKSRPLSRAVLGRQAADDIRDTYDIKQVLGVGQFGVTRLATHKQTQHNYAIKSINKSNLSPAECMIIKQELQIMHLVAGRLGGEKGGWRVEVLVEGGSSA